MAFKIKNKLIGDEKNCFIIAEAGSNHNKDILLAKKLIDAAAEAKADAVKFQLFRAEKLYPSNCGNVRLNNKEVDFFKLIKNMELPVKWLVELKLHAEHKKLIFLCSPFDEQAVDELAEISVDAFKIASPELNHIPLLEYIAKKGKPIIMSTGLSKICEIDEAIDTISKFNKRIAILHCVSAYPAPLEDCNLNVIETFRKIFDIPVGFSDHTLHPIYGPLVAVFKGASIIEKHLTLDKKMEGPDHRFALNPEELKQMVTSIREFEKLEHEEQWKMLNSLIREKELGKILGVFRKIIPESEKELYPGDKRSIVAIKDMKIGERITPHSVAVLRTERNLSPGLHPRYFKGIIGAKLHKPVCYGQGIKWEHLLEK